MLKVDCLLRRRGLRLGYEYGLMQLATLLSSRVYGSWELRGRTSAVADVDDLIE